MREWLSNLFYKLHVYFKSKEDKELEKLHENFVKEGERMMKEAEDEDALYQNFHLIANQILPIDRAEVVELVKVEPKEFDWGSMWNETLLNYMIRIESQVDEAMILGQKVPVDVIIKMFNDVIIGNPYNNPKLRDIIPILKIAIEREPLLDDFRALCKYIKQRLEDKIHGKHIEPLNLKLLK